jgi:hypothetical protein
MERTAKSEERNDDNDDSDGDDEVAAGCERSINPEGSDAGHDKLWRAVIEINRRTIEL